MNGCGFAGFHGRAHQREIFLLRGQIAVLDDEEQRAAGVLADIVGSQPAVLCEDGLDFDHIRRVGLLHLADEFARLGCGDHAALRQLVEALAVFWSSWRMARSSARTVAKRGAKDSSGFGGAGGSAKAATAGESASKAATRDSRREQERTGSACAARGEG